MLKYRTIVNSRHHLNSKGATRYENILQSMKPLICNFFTDWHRKFEKPRLASLNRQRISTKCCGVSKEAERNVLVAKTGLLRVLYLIFFVSKSTFTIRLEFGIKEEENYLLDVFMSSGGTCILQSAPGNWILNPLGLRLPGCGRQTHASQLLPPFCWNWLDFALEQHHGLQMVGQSQASHFVLQWCLDTLLLGLCVWCLVFSSSGPLAKLQCWRCSPCVFLELTDCSMFGVVI